MNNSNIESTPAMETDPEVDSLLDQLEASIFRMGRIMASGRGHPLRGEGMISGPQYMLLKALEGEGSLRVSDAADLLDVKNPAASMLIQSMDDQGLVSREHDSDDRRVIRVSMTDEGRSRLAQAEEHRHIMMRRFTSALSVEDLRNLVRIQNKLVDAIAAETNGDTD